MKFLELVESILNEEKWVSDVKTKWEPPQGLFTRPAEEIAKVLKKESKDLKQAISRINFYENRAGKKLDPKQKKEIEKAKEILRKEFGGE